MTFIIGIDCDGTIVDHRFPDLGEPVPYAFHFMRQFLAAGCQLILWTMRSDALLGESPEFAGIRGGPYLTAAVELCRANGVEFWGVNSNPHQAAWTSSPKIYAHCYIDDAAIGCPLRENPRSGGRPMVDWSIVGPEVMRRIEAHRERSR